ncbi:ABC transporter substrate-binding protein [Trichlorobacter lovleyi]|nr:ABC transporter substrate-binding protein [Trichlorobacter lovleyi]
MIGAGLNLLALLPCPVKVPIEQAFDEYLATLPPERAAALRCQLEGNANIESDYYNTVEQLTELDQFPDIIISPGFNSLFERPFVERFIQTNRFVSVNDYAGDRHLSALGVCDPTGHYTMLAMNLLVPVVDHRRLGGRPVPRCWADLLKREYENSLAIRGHKDGTFCETLLLAIYKDTGVEGLRTMGRNVRYGWHPSQMVKAALGSSADAPAISVMPLFFAQTLVGKEQYSIIWPDDGALISPVTMLVKTEKRAELDDLLAFWAGPQVASIFSGAFFPAVHPGVDNQLPEAATFKWIGWDYIINNDIKKLISGVNAAFRQGRGENIRCA